MRSTIPEAYLICALGAALGACDRGGERVDLSRYIWVDPGPATVSLGRQRAEMRVVVRNVAAFELRRLRLAVQSEACRASVAPEALARLIPGERKAFTVRLERRPGKTEKRYPLLLTLEADGLPVPAGLDLIVDLRGEAAEGWIDVGQVKLVRRSGSRTSTYLLAALPLLFLVGWLLYRLSRRSRHRREPRR